MSVVIVDDDENMRTLMRFHLNRATAVQIVGEATTCAGAVLAWREHRPDLVILDYRMPDGTGLEAARQILDEDPEVAIVMFTAYMSDSNVADAEALGIRAVVSKDQLRSLTDLVILHGSREH